MTNAAEDLAEAFQAATLLHTTLHYTPRWRRRCRRHLNQQLDLACARADAARQLLGAPPDAAGLRTTLDMAAGR